MNQHEIIVKAIQLAAENIEKRGGPFGAVIIKNGELIAEGVNQVTANNDPTAHAEVQAIRAACEKLGTFDLSDCEIYSSCEPCPMCFSAIYWARLSKVYFAATHTDAEDAGFDDAFIYEEIKLAPEERSVPFIEIDHNEKLAPFQKWKKFELKTTY